MKPFAAEFYFSRKGAWLYIFADTWIAFAAHPSLRRGVGVEIELLLFPQLRMASGEGELIPAVWAMEIYWRAPRWLSIWTRSDAGRITDWLAGAVS